MEASIKKLEKDIEKAEKRPRLDRVLDVMDKKCYKNDVEMRDFFREKIAKHIDELWRLQEQKNNETFLKDKRSIPNDVFFLVNDRYATKIRKLAKKSYKKRKKSAKTFSLCTTNPYCSPDIFLDSERSPVFVCYIHRHLAENWIRTRCLVSSCCGVAEKRGMLCSFHKMTIILILVGRAIGMQLPKDIVFKIAHESVYTRYLY